MNIYQWLNLPVQASTQAPKIDFIILLVHALMIVLAMGWGSYFAYSLFRFRASRHKKAVYAHPKTHISTYIEMGILIFEVILLVALSIPFWSKVITKFPPSNKSLTVRVVAQQYAWNIHYPGPDKVFGQTHSRFVDSQTNPLGIDPQDKKGLDDILTVNQLVIPVDKPVIIRLSSLDVIHGFGVPAMRVKQDVVPGMKIPTWFQAKKTGTYEIMCAQLCGVGHYRMRGFVHVKTPEDFDSWMQEKIKENKENQPDSEQDDFWS